MPSAKTRPAPGSRPGDLTQKIDLPKGHKSGLKEALEVLDGVRGVSFTLFKKEDVVRPPLDARFVEAYEKRRPTP